MKNAFSGRSVLALLVALSLPNMAAAQDDQAPAAETTSSTETITVIADPVGLLEDQATDSVFGLDRSVLETPRSFSIVSDTTIDRYGIQDIDDFITTTPGTFGGSFFGVPGAVSVRGSIGDNYFRGFKRAINNGFYPTPIGASSHVELVRGPAPAIYGGGRVGGFLNYYPKTARAAGLTAADGPSGSLEITGGSYSKKNAAVELNLPFLVGGRETSVSIYAEIEDSKSFYRNREPEHQLVQVAFNHDFSENFRIEFGGQYLHAEGYYQTPGWNRVTQDLIDNGTYITGRDTDLQDLDGNGRLTPNEIDAVVGTFFGTSNIRTLIDFGFFFLPDAYVLDEGVGTAQLDRRSVLLTEDDELLDADSFAIYFDAEYTFNDGSVFSLQFFYDDLEAVAGQSTGFAAEHIADVFEVRGSYQFNIQGGNGFEIDVHAQVDHRRYDSELRENFLSGYLVIDRIDLVNGATGNDILDTPFTEEPGGINIPWDSNFDSSWNNTGIALVTDFQFGDLSLLLNGRYEHYNAKSIDTGATIFNPALANTLFTSSQDSFSWSASLSYNINDMIIPYVTYADASSPLQNSNGGFQTGPVAADQLLADSELIEGGVKFSLLDGTLVGSLAYYWQQRTVLDAVGNPFTETGEGFEAEMRWVVTDNWGVTGALTLQEYKISDPGPCFGNGGEFVVIPPTHQDVPGLESFQGYGGIFAALNASCLPELAGGYERKVIPETVASLFVTYTSDEFDWGQFGATFGGTYVSKTGGKIRDAIVLPDYFNFRLSIFAEFGAFSLIATIDNLFDEKYFQPLQGVYEEVGVLPGRGREFRITGKVSF
ncbi:MAG: TonB-dependent siderophore receptor [Alphaproteobacteria bacterium]